MFTGCGHLPDFNNACNYDEPPIDLSVLYNLTESRSGSGLIDPVAGLVGKPMCAQSRCHTNAVCILHRPAEQLANDPTSNWYLGYNHFNMLCYRSTQSDTKAPTAKAAQMW
jgi:hypothetical protein